ncbi:hypothetical protein INR49_027208 [Caranx melampygus]|nr:hypothetical protein INR49_027208 [Caranx melampygus]
MFGQSIKVTVTPQDPRGAGPDGPESSAACGLGGPAPDDVGPDVCLAAGFRPPEGKLLLNTVNGSVPLNISKAMVSKEQKTYFYAGFSDQTMLSCELNASTSNDDNVGRCADLHPEGARLNFYLLLLNSVRVVFTKTVAFSTMVTIRAMLF